MLESLWRCSWSVQALVCFPRAAPLAERRAICCVDPILRLSSQKLSYDSPSRIMSGDHTVTEYRSCWCWHSYDGDTNKKKYMSEIIISGCYSFDWQTTDRTKARRRTGWPIHTRRIYSWTVYTAVFGVLLRRTHHFASVLPCIGWTEPFADCCLLMALCLLHIHAITTSLHIHIGGGWWNIFFSYRIARTLICVMCMLELGLLVGAWVATQRPFIIYALL